jgi:hypothetical protein
MHALTVAAQGVPGVVAGAGDAVRLRDAGRPTLTATSDAEVLAWEMHEGLGD